MSINRLVITAVVIENRPVRDVAVEYGVSKSWIYLLLARYRTEGEVAFEPPYAATQDRPDHDTGRDRRPDPRTTRKADRDRPGRRPRHDCSRYALSVTAHHRVTGTIVLATFRQTIAEHGIPASTLTDNGMVFTTRLSQGKKGAGTRNGFETELRRLGIVQKNSTPGHPTTCGKVEAVPADAEEVAARPTGAADHDR